MAEKVKKIGLAAAVIVGFNAMVGAGVTVMPTILSRSVGPAGTISLLLAMLITIAMGISLGKAARIFGGSAWSYVYSSSWAGHSVGIASSLLYILGLLSAMGVLVQSLGQIASEIVPQISPATFGISVVVLLAALVWLGAETSSITQYLIAFAVAISLLGSGIFGWFHFDPKTVENFIPFGKLAIIKAVPTLLFSFLGFEVVSSLAAVVANPEKNISRGTSWSITRVGILYFTFVFGIMFSIPTVLFQTSTSTPLSSIIKAYFPEWQIVGNLVLVGSIFGIVGTIHSVIWATEELLRETTEKLRSKLLRKIFLRDEKKMKRSTAILFCVLVIIASTIVGSLEKLTVLSVFLISPSYSLATASLLFYNDEDDGKSYKKILPIISVVGGIALIIISATSIIELLTEAAA
jgi:arginine:agmatine antiporter